jgi:hypothetical protein
VPDHVWSGFHLDPRRPEHARVRATEADRDHARALFGEAYADGRLTRAELDARSAKLDGPVTLGALKHLVADLEPVHAAPAGAAAPTPARRTPARELLVFLVCSLACVLLWALTGRGFFWPLWVIVYTGIPPVASFVRTARGARRGKGHTL